MRRTTNGPTPRFWRWRRRLAYRLLAQPAVAVSAPNDHAPVRLDFPDADIWLRVTSEPERRWRARSCAKEPFTIDWIRQSLQPGDVLYDIGANVGAFSLVAAIGRQASVVAFEPGYANFARLIENIHLNACAASIVPVPLPLSDTPGLRSFAYRSVEPGQSRHSLGETHALAGEAARQWPYVQSMCVTTLDRAVADFELPRPNHLKIDVDGSELQVLRGAVEVLRGAQLRTVLLETDDAQSEALAAELTNADFRLQSRHDRPAKPDAPVYAVWAR